MEKSLLKKAAIQSVALMIAVIMLSYAMKHQQMITIMASNLFSDDRISTEAALNPEAEVIAIDKEEAEDPIQTHEEVTAPITDVTSLKSRIDDSILQQLSDNFLVIKKPLGSNESLQLEDLYINQSIQLNLAGLTSEDINNNMVLRVRDNDLYVGNPIYDEIVTMETDDEKGTSEEVVTRDYGEDLSHGITITTEQDAATNLYTAQILIELDNVYAYIIYEDTDYYYINLKKPSEVYDKILVIDAGHGGKDAGAVSKGKQYYEKDINLGIVLELKRLLDKEDIKVYYTRTSDDTVFLRPRVKLANAVDCDYFISIHCNANEVTYPNGIEVLYYDYEFKGVKSFDLANLFSDEIAKTSALKRKGTVEKHGDDILIMDKSLVPTILIEAGYMTNNNDMNYLSKPENRHAVAQGIYNGIMKAYEELPVTE